MEIRTYTDKSNCRRAARKALGHEDFEIMKTDDGEFYFIDLSPEAAEAAGKENDAPTPVMPEPEVAWNSPEAIAENAAIEKEAAVAHDAAEGLATLASAIGEAELEEEPEDEGFETPAPKAKLGIDLADCGLTPDVMELIMAMGLEAGEAKPVAKPRKSLLDAAQKAAEAGCLPPVPTFPASNATYAVHAQRLQEMAAANNADALLAFEVKGTNTYAKALKRYRDVLITYLEYIAPENMEEAA
jgi:hypothetical protein